MQLSVLLPTHRHDLAALARITQACSWAGPSIEVLVRDNSGNAEKRDAIKRFQRDNCTIICVDPCEPRENVAALMQLAKGDFVFCIGDDDMYFDRAMLALPEAIDTCRDDQGVAGFFGTYLVEASQGAALINYPGIEADEVTSRVGGFLSHTGVNSLFYSVQRRSMLQRVYDFMGAIPFHLSYHDQIYCLLYVLNGKFVKLPRLIYGYNVGIWEHRDSAQKRDVDFYRAAGLDLAINKLQWFLCGFEGAVLIRNSDLFPDHSPTQRQAMTDLWFSTMFRRQVLDVRSSYESRFATQVETLCQKLRASEGRLSFADMLTDICEFIALFSPEKAQAYLTFWATQMRPRTQAAAAAR